MLPWTVTLPTASRTSAILKNKLAMQKKDLRIRPTPWRPGLIPGLIAMSGALLTEKVMKKCVEKTVLFDEKDCPLCVQLRGGSLQCLTGVFAPYLITVSAVTFSIFWQRKQFEVQNVLRLFWDNRKGKWFKQPKLKPKEYEREWKTLGKVIKEIGKIGWKNRSIIGYSMVAQFALNVFYVSQLQSEWFTIQNNIYKKSAIMNNNSASFNNVKIS